MTLRSEEKDEPIDLTIVTITILSELDTNRAVVARGLLLLTNIGTTIEKNSNFKKKMVQGCMVGFKLCANLVSMKIKLYAVKFSLDFVIEV